MLSIILIGLALIAFFLSIIGYDGGRGIPVGLFLIALWLLLDATGVAH